jgi:nicotinate-nucleotide adenylyltransferase
MAMDTSEPKIGIFGGTFDPVHLGHLRVAEEVRESFGLEEVWFVLSARPPHKGGLAHAPVEDRWEMLKMALENNPHFKPCDLELKREGPSYSIDTVRELRKTLKVQLFFIIGEDAFLEIRTWKDWKELLESCNFAVMKRTRRNLTGFLRELGYEKVNPSEFKNQKGTSLYLVKVTKLEISSTLIRTLVKNGSSINYLVPEQVRKYILEKGLYRS